MSRTAALSYAIGLLLALPALVLLPVGRLDGAAGTVFAVLVVVHGIAAFFLWRVNPMMDLEKSLLKSNS